MGVGALLGALFYAQVVGVRLLRLGGLLRVWRRSDADGLPRKVGTTKEREPHMQQRRWGACEDLELKMVETRASAGP